MSGHYIIDSVQECISTGEGVYEAILVGQLQSVTVARKEVSGSASKSQQEDYLAAVRARVGGGSTVPTSEIHEWQKKTFSDIGASVCVDVENVDSKKVVRELIHEWSEPLSDAIEGQTWEEITRVLRTSSNMCRSLIAAVKAKGTPIDVARIIGYVPERLPGDFMRLVQRASKPGMSWFMPGFHSNEMGAFLYMSAQEALPFAESLERAAQLDRVLPQAAPLAASRRF